MMKILRVNSGIFSYTMSMIRFMSRASMREMMASLSKLSIARLTLLFSSGSVSRVRSIVRWLSARLRAIVKRNERMLRCGSIRSRLVQREAKVSWARSSDSGPSCT